MKKTLNSLRMFRMKLNPKKCAFKVSTGKFLGFMTNERWIKANSKKIQVLIDIPSLRTVKEVQKLIGYIVALR